MIDERYGEINEIFNSYFTVIPTLYFYLYVLLLPYSKEEG